MSVSHHTTTYISFFLQVMYFVHFVLAIIFSDPAQFKILVSISFFAVGLAAVLYSTYHRKMRGHLFHLPSCLVSNQAQRTDTLRHVQLDEVVDINEEERAEGSGDSELVGVVPGCSQSEPNRQGGASVTAHASKALTSSALADNRANGTAADEAAKMETDGAKV